MHRFSRTEKIIGSQGLEILARSKVAIFGLGGVGSFAAEALARSGIGHFLLVDPDVVDISNINRQLHALSDTVGQSKVSLMADRFKKINPSVKVDARRERFTNLNSHILLTGDLSYVVDAIDDVNNKVHLLKSCYERNIPVVSAMGTGNKLNPTAFKVMDISETSICPLARKVRRELRKNNIYSGITVVCSGEKPFRPRVQDTPENSTAPGSIAFVPPVAGMILASVVANKLIENIT
jgi:tRNA A37 threonylcarbamoyladenosine dehydratase